MGATWDVNDFPTAAFSVFWFFRGILEGSWKLSWGGLDMEFVRGGCASSGLLKEHTRLEPSRWNKNNKWSNWKGGKKGNRPKKRKEGPSNWMQLFWGRVPLLK